MHHFWAIIETLQHELLLFSAIWFLVGAADELIVDLIWFWHKFRRWLFRYRHAPPLRATELALPSRSGLLAVFVATWKEAVVIEDMLRRCNAAWKDSPVRYRLYVGCYPNDPEGVAAIRRGAAGNPHCRLVLCSQSGPTTKADCLNHLWRALIADELAAGFKAKAVVLHDAEDFVHADELKIYALLIEKADAVQLPVIPMQVPGSTWVSGHYGDEFAEAHGKTLVVREAIGAAIPLAGVGCAIERNHLGRIALAQNGAPFDQQSLTEDYEMGLGVAGPGQRTIFARILDSAGDLVGTRACFPSTLSASVRQKSRWMTGIALAGWDRLGWRGGIAETWMRVRDRKAVFATIVLSAAYICIILTGLLVLAHLAGLYEPQSLSPILVQLLIANSVMLVWRVTVRAGFVAQAQGWRAAILSVPRTLIANVISILAARRAITNYAAHLLGSALQWDKTSHTHFPEFHAQRRTPSA